MNLIKNLKQKVKALKQEMTALYYAYKSPKLSILPKLIIALCIGYFLSPIDLIPDFIPIIGYLDDLIILPLLISLSIKLIPSDFMEECREEARRNPISLKKNWIAGIVFILIWILILYLIIAAFIK